MLVLPASLIFPSLHSIHVTDENQQDLIAFFKLILAVTNLSLYMGKK
jgi:hypothetical protein